MRTALHGIAISGVVFFGVVSTSTAYGQEADNSTELAQDLQDSEDEALASTGEDLGDATNDTENSLKNEFNKDVALLKQALKTPTPTVIPNAGATPTPDDSLREIEREIDSLEAQSKALSQ